eukprot:6268423-Prymnesium_polylepis.1
MRTDVPSAATARVHSVLASTPRVAARATARQRAQANGRSAVAARVCAPPRGSPTLPDAPAPSCDDFTSH